MKSWRLAVLPAVILLVAYLLTWPVPIDPVAWKAPENPGYTNDFEPNSGLSALRRVDLDGHTGPEDAAIGPDGALYIATHEGNIVKYHPDSETVTVFAETGGRPLGIEFGSNGDLFVADAYRGLLKISRAGKVTLLSDETSAGSPIIYADDLDIGSDPAIGRRIVSPPALGQELDTRASHFL